MQIEHLPTRQVEEEKERKKKKRKKEKRKKKRIGQKDKRHGESDEMKRGETKASGNSRQLVIVRFIRFLESLGEFIERRGERVGWARHECTSSSFSVPTQLERCNWANRISRHVQPLTKLLYTRSGGALIGPALHFVSPCVPISREKAERK